MKHLDAAFVDAVFEIGSWIIKFGKTSKGGKTKRVNMWSV